ncbi:MAG: CHAT domain-containing protein [Desulfobacteraceae bacterium]|nr:CHAT domain-containing protein [Desulfobacteraceae bacterium]
MLRNNEWDKCGVRLWRRGRCGGDLRAGAGFFYAGSRAILVSLWPVETTSAKHLTTGIFARQQAAPRLGRARALRSSILAMMYSPGLVDLTTDKIAASYAHPMFWGPFILVGEGAAGLGPVTQ